MVIIEIDVGTTVQVISGDANLFTLVTFSQWTHFYLAFSGDGHALFHLYISGFNSF